MKLRLQLTSRRLSATNIHLLPASEPLTSTRPPTLDFCLLKEMASLFGPQSLSPLTRFALSLSPALHSSPILGPGWEAVDGILQVEGGDNRVS